MKRRWVSQKVTVTYVKRYLLGAAVLCAAVLLAAAVLRGHLPKEKKDYRAMVQLGSDYQEKGDRKTALKYFKDAARTEPDRPQAHFFLGRLYFLMQKGEDAVGELTVFMEKMDDPENAVLMEKEAYINCLHNVNDICSSLKSYAAAKDALDRIIALDPKDQRAYHNLGVYYYNAEHDRSKAYQNFKKAADLDPNTSIAKSAKYAIEFMRNNPDSRVAPDLSFIDQEYRE